MIPSTVTQFYLMHGERVVDGPWKVKGAATAARNRITKYKARRARFGDDASNYHPHAAEYVVRCALYELKGIG